MCGFWLENSGFADLFLAPAGWLAVYITAIKSPKSAFCGLWLKMRVK